MFELLDIDVSNVRCQLIGFALGKEFLFISNVENLGGTVDLSILCKHFPHYLHSSPATNLLSNFLFSLVLDYFSRNLPALCQEYHVRFLFRDDESH
jgi:hypothetical protein